MSSDNKQPRDDETLPSIVDETLPEVDSNKSFSPDIILDFSKSGPIPVVTKETLVKNTADIIDTLQDALKAMGKIQSTLIKGGMNDDLKSQIQASKKLFDALRNHVDEQQFYISYEDNLRAWAPPPSASAEADTHSSRIVADYGGVNVDPSDLDNDWGDDDVPSDSSKAEGEKGQKPSPEMSPGELRHDGKKGPEIV